MLLRNRSSKIKVVKTSIGHYSAKYHWTQTERGITMWKTLTCCEYAQLLLAENLPMKIRWNPVRSNWEIVKMTVEIAWKGYIIELNMWLIYTTSIGSEAFQFLKREEFWQIKFWNGYNCFEIFRPEQRADMHSSTL